MLSSNGFPFAPKGIKLLKPKFGFDCYVVYRIVYSIEYVNDMFGMTKNFSRGLQIMLLGRYSITQATVV